MGKYKIILVDSDIVRHFIVAGRIDDLPEILSPNLIFIVEDVYNELARDPDRKKTVDNWLQAKHIARISLPFHNENIRREFYRLKKEDWKKGDGERACLALARFNKEVIASSNFRDIKDYADCFGIEYLGCIDILYIAWKNQFFSEEDCDCFISDAINHNCARFPCDKISKYIPDRDLTYWIHS